MFRTKSSFRALLSIAVVFVLSLSVLADTIRLKDGSIIKGSIEGFAGGRFTVVVGEGARRRELTLAADEIASIEFDARQLSTTASLRNSQPASESKIVPVSTRPTEPATRSNDQRTANSQVYTPPVRNDDSVTNSKPVRVPTVQQPEPPANRSTTSTSPIAFNVKVLADNTANGWTNSGFVVKKGQRIRVTGNGTVSLGKGQTSAPEGLPDVEDAGKLLKSVPTGALLAVIGDDNNDFIYIGSSREFTAGRDGALYLGVNEGNLNDNSGSFDVKIEIIPGT